VGNKVGLVVLHPGSDIGADTVNYAGVKCLHDILTA
jgi:hypothetical protein